MFKFLKNRKFKAIASVTIFSACALSAAVAIPLVSASRRLADRKEGTLNRLVQELSSWISEDAELSTYVMKDDRQYLNEELKDKIKSFLNKNKNFSFKYAVVQSIWYDPTNFFHPVIKVLIKDTLSNEQVEASIDSFSWDEAIFSRIFTYTRSNGKIEITGLTQEAKERLQNNIVDIYLPNYVTFTNPTTQKGENNPVSSIGQMAFARLDGIQAFKFTNPKTSRLEEIKQFAFSDMIDLSELTVPASVTNIVDNPWVASSGYRIDIDKANNRYSVKAATSSNYLYDNTTKSIVAVTDTMISGNEFLLVDTEVVSIGKYAFANLIGLGSVNLNGTLITSIAENAFAITDPNKFNSVLSQVFIPESLKTIGTQAFYNLSELNVFGPSDQKKGLLLLTNEIVEIGLNAFTNSKFKELSLLRKQRDNQKVWQGLSNLGITNINIRDEVGNSPY